MSKRDASRDEWVETCCECGKDFVGKSNPTSPAENPFLQLVEHFASEHRDKTIVCPRRSEGTVLGYPDGDFWQVKPSGDRVCSYCGGMHPEDFIRFCKRVIANPTHCISHSNKLYKVYVHRPGVRNADDGAIKLYKFHITATDNELETQRKIYDEALAISNKRLGVRIASVGYA